MLYGKKLLGIDYGARTVGVAITDESVAVKRIACSADKHHIIVKCSIVDSFDVF